jgi:serine protease AprX
VLGLAEEAARACWTPLEWQRAKPVPWSRDANRNSIDDSLDAILEKDPSQKVAVVLDLAGCADAAAMEKLATYGTVLKRGRFVTFVAMEVEASRLPELADLPTVAMIEEMHGFAAALDVSGAAIKVRSGFYSPQTLEDAIPTLRGLGRTLAVIDSGVDDQDGAGTTHQMFPPGKFVGGYIVSTNLLGNPNDGNSHGTHVAGIAIGAQVGTRRGMAPDASLVDCQTTLQCGPPSWLDVIECFEQILLNDPAWGVDVVNLSLRQCDSGGQTITTDGTDAASKMANHLVARGINVVAAAGNDGPTNVGLTSPCAADNAICVAAMDDLGTQNRVDDAIASFSSRGPRANDGDLDGLDESKPDVSAPGVNISSANFNTLNGFTNKSGTSMASPHVAGAAILIAEAKPGINPGSLKHLLINTSEDRGPAGWDPANGHGYVDLYQAVAAVATADPGYPGAGTYPQPWLCSDITPQSPPVVGVPNTLIATVRNNTINPANNVQVTFGVFIYSSGIPEFFSIGAQTVNVPAFTQINVTHPWTPQASSSGDPHACLKSTINYGFDTNFTNNLCNRNISIDQTNSPVSFRFQVQNKLTQTATIKLVPTPLTRFPRELAGEAAYRMLPGERMWVPARWTHKITEEQLIMEPGDCPVDVTLTLDLADDARPVDAAIYDVPGLAVLEGGKEVVMDGITAYGHSPCPAQWGGDTDGDAVCDVFDICADIMNPEQIDADGDGKGDVCDPKPYAADNPGNDDTCRQKVKSGELAGSQAYACLDSFKKNLGLASANPVGAAAVAPALKPAQRIVGDKINAAQTDLCREADAQAAARLQALQHQVALMQEVGALTSTERSSYTAKADQCQKLVPAASAAKPVQPSSSPAAR